MALFDSHELLSVDEAAAEKKRMDELAFSEAWNESWWAKSWHPFASDGAGQLLVVDEQSGAVIEFLHDDDARPALADSLDAYLADVADRLEGGALVYDAELGIVDAGLRGRLEASATARAERGKVFDVRARWAPLFVAGCFLPLLLFIMWLEGCFG